MKFNFKKISYVVISVTSSQLRHQTKVTNFFHFGPLPIKISGYASGFGILMELGVA